MQPDTIDRCQGKVAWHIGICCSHVSAQWANAVSMQVHGIAYRTISEGIPSPPCAKHISRRIMCHFNRSFSCGCRQNNSLIDSSRRMNLLMRQVRTHAFAIACLKAASVSTQCQSRMPCRGCATTCYFLNLCEFIYAKHDTI